MTGRNEMVSSGSGRALDNIVVLELGQIYNGPYCGLLMAHLGADVTKIEPLHGEATRWRTARAEAYPFLMLNAGKRGVTLNLKDARGKEVFLRLAESADVVIENFSHGVMDRLGLGFDVLHAVNQRLILASGSGFGSSGHYRDLPAMDLTIQAMTGVMASTGFASQPPVKAGVALSDFLGGVHLFGGVMAALLQRERTGFGQTVEVAMYDAVIPTLTSNLGGFFESQGTLPERTGNRHNGMAMCPYNVYQTSDGWAAIFCVTERHWLALCEVLGRHDLAAIGELRETSVRASKMGELDDIVEGWTSTVTSKSVVEELVGRGVPAAEVKRLADVVTDVQVAERHMLPETDHPTMGRVHYLGSPIRLSMSRDLDLGPAPLLGQHTRAVLRQCLGIAEEALDNLATASVI